MQERPQYWAKGMTESQKLTELENICDQSLSGNPERAKDRLAPFQESDLAPALRSRYLAASAYVAIREGNPGLGIRLLHESSKLDPSFSLTQLSLGRHYLFTVADGGLARPYFERAIVDDPSSIRTLFGMVSLEAETGAYRNALAASLTLLRQYPGSVRAWLSVLSSAILSSPGTGRLFAVVFAALAFLPWLGPVVLAAWLPVLILAFLGLRRLSPRLSLTPALCYIPYLLSFFIRWTVYGRWYP